jgi:hypothetical protein
MRASFDSARMFDLCGGRYQYINKDWLMGYINNIAGYFIILYQFQPVLDDDMVRAIPYSLCQFTQNAIQIQPCLHELHRKTSGNGGRILEFFWKDLNDFRLITTILRCPHQLLHISVWVVIDS